MMVFLIVLFGEGSSRQRNQHVQRQRGEAKYNINKESMIISQGVYWGISGRSIWKGRQDLFFPYC